MDKLDIEKIREQKKAKELAKQTAEGDFRLPIHFNGIDDIKLALSDIREAIENKDDTELDKVTDQLKEMVKQLDLSPYFTDLEKSLNKVLTTNSSNSLKDKQLQAKDFSRFLDKVELSLKNQKPNVTVKANDITSEYLRADDELGDPNSFFGYLHPTGKWFICRQSGLDNATFRYAAGRSNYSDNWKTKSSLTYLMPNEVKL